VKPNIMLIMAEDICPNLGCYGDPNAYTPHLDAFAEESVRFTNVYSVHPCCTPSRACLATGVYPTRLGTHQMRGRVNVFAEDAKCATTLLREAGYYCFNGCRGGTYKTDYNFDPQDQPWDKTHSVDYEWRNRKNGQPFFGQVNLDETHQSMYGQRKPGSKDRYDIHKPENMVLPAYTPDTPAAREIWCEFHEQVTIMDSMFAGIVNALKDDGLLENTIIIFLGDNGMGIPGGKVWIWEQGLHVPMMIRFPESLRGTYDAAPGSVRDGFFSFVDFAPTLLGLAGLQPPETMQGMDMFKGNTRSHCFAARDYHDGADMDATRVVVTERFHYIRNLYPFYGWDAIPYSWAKAPWFLEEWRQEAEHGRLNADTRQHAFFHRFKPVEELYDRQNDPAQMNNLAADPAFCSELTDLRERCLASMAENRDLGLLSQYQLYIHSEQDSPYRMGQDPARFPVNVVLDACIQAGDGYEAIRTGKLNVEACIASLHGLIAHQESAVRYWGIYGLLGAARLPVGKGVPQLPKMAEALLDDPAPDVSVMACETLLVLGEHGQAVQTLIRHLAHESRLIRFQALMSISRIGENARETAPYFEFAVTPCKHMGVPTWDDVSIAIDRARGVLDIQAPKRLTSGRYKTFDGKGSRQTYPITTH
jgi:uncharacterized sulfatase